jgi:4-carboxymuconolactone decarboxylase
MSGEDSVRVEMMTPPGDSHATVVPLDAAMTALVQLSAILTVGSETEVRSALSTALPVVDAEWIEEVILQTYLFAGFPRALNAMRDWRRISGRSAPLDDGEALDTNFVARGQQTCATVYGRFYDALRVNVRELHPALDLWMVSDGYGKVLGRSGLALWRRELCIVAACAAGRQDRQLHSHLHGAINAGASVAQVDATLDAIASLVTADDLHRYRLLWARVQNH